MIYYLSHHGVKGQKWGIRYGPPYPLSEGQKKRFKDIDSVLNKPKVSDAHKIKKGTVMYRSTTNANESNDGSTYVTFRNEDRKHYQGYIGINAKNQGKKAYEKTLKLKEDLYVPSQDELKEAQRKALSDPKLKQDALDGIYDFYVQSVADKRVDTERLKDYNKITKQLKNSEILDEYYDDVGQAGVYDTETHKRRSIKLSEKEYNNVMTQMDVNMQVKQAKEDIAENRVDDFAFASIAMMYGKKYKEAVIKDLSSKGYNAMVDEAGVGVSKDANGKTLREGTETLIIFDRAKTLEETSTREISNDESMESWREFSRWMNRNKYR